jgi:hypothetical protein
MAYSSPAKLDPQVKDILVDPIGRFPLRWTPAGAVSDYGAAYGFEQWEKRVAKEVERDYTSELGGVREI